jgi:type VI secretion system protein ImpC
MSSEAERQKAETVTEVQEGESLLTQILEQGRLARDEYQVAQARDMIAEFVGQIMQGQMVVSKNTEAMINARIAEIDRLVSLQLNEIMHHEDFQKLEGSWRGLRHLVFESETGTQHKIRVLNV